PLTRGRGGVPMAGKGTPPRLRLLRWLREILLMTQPQLLAVMRGGEYSPDLNSFTPVTALQSAHQLRQRPDATHCFEPVYISKGALGRGVTDHAAAAGAKLRLQFVPTHGDFGASLRKLLVKSVSLAVLEPDRNRRGTTSVRSRLKLRIDLHFHLLEQ